MNPKPWNVTLKDDGTDDGAATQFDLISELSRRPTRRPVVFSTTGPVSGDVL